MKWAVDFHGFIYIKVGKLYPVTEHSLGVDAVHCNGAVYNVDVLDLLVEFDE